MKKILLWLIALVTVSSNFECCSSCSVKNSTIATAAANAIITHIKSSKALNGIESDRSGRMIQHFIDLKQMDATPMAVSVWLDKDLINSIDTLLNTEKKDPNRKDKTDGVRLYFSADPAITATRIGQLYNSILLISTKNIKATVPAISDHVDYYDHNADFLNSPITQYIKYNMYDPGALLYNRTSPCAIEEACKMDTKNSHYVSCDSAYKWVGQHNAGPINTISEWFDLSFLDDLNSAIKANNLSGIRIYFAKGYIEPISPTPLLQRNVMLLVPTIDDGNVHKDYYKCLNKFTEIFDKGELCPYKCTTP